MLIVAAIGELDSTIEPSLDLGVTGALNSSIEPCLDLGVSQADDLGVGSGEAPGKLTHVDTSERAMPDRDEPPLDHSGEPSLVCCVW